MATSPRIFVSVPDDRHLDDRRRLLKRAILQRLAKSGFDLRGFEAEQFRAAGPAHTLDAWSIERAVSLIRGCDGAVVVGLARAHGQPPAGDALASPPAPQQATPFNHLEGALAVASHLPVFILRDQEVAPLGIFSSGIKPVEIPSDADGRWVNGKSFLWHLDTWSSSVRERRDVFLGYCSRANATAAALRTRLEAADFSVLDWARDFAPAGKTILGEIERASRRCRSAIFLFTRDDDLEEYATGTVSDQSIPRDNVLLEAGYFTRALGSERVAIVREMGTKMPADLGGIIYISLERRDDTREVESKLLKFLGGALR